MKLFKRKSNRKILKDMADDIFAMRVSIKNIDTNQRLVIDILQAAMTEEKPSGQEAS